MAKRGKMRQRTSGKISKSWNSLRKVREEQKRWKRTRKSLKGAKEVGRQKRKLDGTNRCGLMGTNTTLADQTPLVILGL